MPYRNAVKFAFRTLTILIVGGPLAAWSAQGPDTLWEITSKMEMSGMPMAMPASTNRICLPKDGQDNASMIPTANNCRTDEIKRSGNTISFSMTCTEGKDTYGGRGEIEQSGDAYQGTIRMSGTVDGEKMEMNQSFSGKRVGNCTYQDPSKLVAKYENLGKQELVDHCKQAAEDLVPQLFVATPENPRPFCVDKTPFTKHAEQVWKEIQDYRAYQPARDKYNQLDAAMNAVGHDAQAMQALNGKHCSQAVAAKSWAFVANSCPPDVASLGAQHCRGRSYTLTMKSEFAPICSRYMASAGGQGGGASPAGGPPNAEDAAKQGVQEGAQEMVKQGTEKLKKLFRF